MDVVERFKVNRDKGRASGCISLMEGIPGVDTLKPCREILQKATTHLLDSELNTSRTFAYGPEQGDEEVRRVLASFLTEQYGHEEPVDADKIILTAGATQGAHLIATLLFGHGTTCFIEDPTYFIMHKMLSEDLKMNLIPVKLDSEGMDVEELDKLLTQHKPDVIPEDQLYWSFIYSIPVYHNPTGISYSPERCRALIECARKHKVLIIAEDVYNLLCYNTPHPPKRLIAYDNPSDPNYYGSVVSNGTFSKILAPCFRLGWIEGPDAVVQRLVKSFVAYSGGSFNHFGSLVASSILKLNLLQPHIESLKKIYGGRMKIVCDTLKKIPNIKLSPSEGGFFVWIELPSEIDSSDLMEDAVNNYGVYFIPGACTSPTRSFSNYVRLSISAEPEENIVKGINAFVKLLQETLSK